MRRAGIRRVRQDLSALLKEVHRGHEVEITDRGEAVARLVSPVAKQARPFRGRSKLRATMPKLTAPLSLAIIDERENRL
ncbi:MAG: type II toxin-antitoxin system Phd/YefM family antitoxin [Myxococcota bacterium]